MSAPLAASTIDSILAVQVTVAWAGESKATGRLGWWDTDLIDSTGGRDLLARLLPRTHRWAALEAARLAARRVEHDMLRTLGDRDRLRTLFHLGDEVDDALAERIAELKREGRAPGTALALPLDFDEKFDATALERALVGGRRAEYEVVPAGRQLSARFPEAVADAARALASALFPLTDRYPFPMYRFAAR